MTDPKTVTVQERLRDEPRPGLQWEIRYEAADLLDRCRAALTELVAVVRGECPSLLDEDSGGDAALDCEIDAILTQLNGGRNVG